VSTLPGDTHARVWFEVKEPRDSYEGEVEVRLEDDET